MDQKLNCVRVSFRAFGFNKGDAMNILKDLMVKHTVPNDVMDESDEISYGGVMVIFPIKPPVSRKKAMKN